MMAGIHRTEIDRSATDARATSGGTLSNPLGTLSRASPCLL